MRISKKAFSEAKGHDVIVRMKDRSAYCGEPEWIEDHNIKFCNIYIMKTVDEQQKKQEKVRTSIGVILDEEDILSLEVQPIITPVEIIS